LILIKEFKREPLGKEAESIEIHTDNERKESEVDLREVEEILVSPERIQEIVDLSREDASLFSNKTYSEVFRKVIAENNRQMKSLGKDILEEKANTYKRISKSLPAPVDISSSRSLKAQYTEVFGKRSNSISFEDYAALLELKKLLEINEQEGLLGVEEI